MGGAGAAGVHDLFTTSSQIAGVQIAGSLYADRQMTRSRALLQAPSGRVARSLGSRGVRRLLAGAFGLLAVGVLSACGGGGEDPVITIAVPSETAVVETTTPRATSTPRPSQTASAEAVQAISSLTDFIDAHGYPSDATFATLKIPKLGVEAKVASRVVGSDGVMADPEGPAEVIWYDLSSWAGMGGVPGGGGNAVFSGHVDYNWTVNYAGGVHYRGPGVFRELAALQLGDVIEVAYGGTTFRYAVVSNDQFNATSGDWGSVWRHGSGDSITLYTCGGEFDFDALEYSDRVVVRAERIQ